VARVVAAVRDELKLENDPPYRSRDAVGGRHVSVTFQPTVATPDEKTRAEEVAKNTSGVSSVVNNLKVVPKKQ